MSETPAPKAPTELATRFNRLFRDGKLLQIHVNKWSMSTRLDATDLPIEEGKNIPTFAKLGAKMLIDEKELRKFVSIEGAARTYLRSHAHPFPIAQAHFVPNKTLLPVLESLEALRVKYMALVEVFVANYEVHKEATLAKYPDHREALLPCFPPVDRLRERFGFHVGLFEVAFPRQMKEIDLASVQAEAETKAAMQTKFEAEWGRQYAQSMEQVDTFLKDATSKMRGRIVEVFETIARKIRDHEVVSATNMKTMSSIIDAFDGLDFLDDKTVRAKLVAVKALISSGQDFKSDNDAIDALGVAIGDVLTVAKDTTDLDALTGEYVRRIDL